MRIEHGEFGGETEISLGRNGGPYDFGPWEVELVGEEYFESFAFPVTNVRLNESGEYEFQLLVDGVADDEPIYRERFYARD